MLFFSGSGPFFKPGGYDRLQKRHHGAKFGAELLNGMLLLTLTSGQEVRATLFVLLDPGLCETAVADLRQDFAHLFARLLGDNARSCGIIPLLRSVADGVTHIAEAAAINQVDDELEFMEAFEISDFGLVASFRECLKARFDQFTHTSAQYGLLAKQVGFGLFGESRFQNAGARAAEPFSISEGQRLRRAAGILFDGQQRGRSTAFGENFANTVAGRFWSDHGDVNGGRRLDGAEADVEAVREHQSLALLEIWLNGVAI